jgi:hypothetical protein
MKKKSFWLYPNPNCAVNARAVEERIHTIVDVLAQLADGALADPASPMACTRSSTSRVETPPTQASWITATRA